MRAVIQLVHVIHQHLPRGDPFETQLCYSGYGSVFAMV